MNASDHNPYGCQDDLAFKANGTDDARPHNLTRALGDLREWCIGRGCRNDASLALSFLKGHLPAARVELVIIETSFTYDEAVDTEAIRGICCPAYNRIEARLNAPSLATYRPARRRR